MQKKDFIYVGIILAILIYNYSNSQSSNQPAITNVSTPTLSVSNSALPSTPVNYDSKEGNVYYYTAGVSDNDIKRGVAAGQALGIRYFGINSKGEYVLAMVSPNGTIAGKSYCRKPCQVIRESDGSRIGYNENSVIGAAFADALQGNLMQSLPPKPRTVLTEKMREDQN